MFFSTFDFIGALNFIDTQLGLFQSAISKSANPNTIIIFTAKHGQSPTNTSTLNRINDGTIFAAMNQSWNVYGHKNVPNFKVLRL